MEPSQRSAVGKRFLRSLRRFCIPLALIIFTIVFLIVNRHSWRSKVRAVWEWSPASNKVETYHFKTTSVEEDCQRGKNPLPVGVKPVPNVVHYVVGLSDPELTFSTFLSMRSALQSISPQKLKIHHGGDLNLANAYVRTLLEDKRVTVVSHQLESVAADIRASRHFSKIADVLRLQILHQEGGIYLDSDMFILKPFDGLRNSTRNVVLGHEGGNRLGLRNAVIIARPKAPFLERWIESYKTFRSGVWSDQSVFVPKKMATQTPWEVCPLSPHTFFWPTSATKKLRWMHDRLSESEAETVRTTLSVNDGSLFWGQLAYHGWNQKAWQLSKLTKETILTQDTRFNIMMRRFLKT